MAIRKTTSGRYEVDIWVYDVARQKNRRVQKTFDAYREAQKYERDSRSQSDDGGFIDSRKLPPLRRGLR